MNIYFLHDPWILENHNLKALNISFQKVVLSGREKCGATEVQWWVMAARREKSKYVARKRK